MKENQTYKFLLLATIFIVGFFSLKASHILGAEISYKHLQNSSYSFKLKVYRNCSECKFGGIGGGQNSGNCNDIGNLQIRGGLGTSYFNQQLGMVELTRKQVINRTSNCNSTNSQCDPNSNIAYGFEEHVFEGRFNFSNLLNQNFCSFDVSIGLASRNNRINPNMAEQNFFNYCSLNLCKGINNESVDFTLPPSFLYYQNQSNFNALGVFNIDKDSLSFKLKSALINRTTNVSYNINRSFLTPFSYYCRNGQMNCSANISGSLVEGFYISDASGDVAFTPLQNAESGIVVIECEEWKKDMNGKYFLAGIVRRDINSEIITSINNLPKIEALPTNIELCSNETKSLVFNVIDVPGINSLQDSVFLKVNTNLQNFQIARLSNLNAQTARFMLTFSNSQNEAGIYLVSLYANDNACPLNGSGSVSLNVLLKKVPNTKIDYVKVNCGSMTFALTNKINQNLFWKFKTINGGLVKQSLGKKMAVKITENGKYIIEGFIPATATECELLLIDTINIRDLDYPEILMNKEVLVCKNTNHQFEPLSLLKTNNYQIFANNALISFPYTYNVTKKEDIVFKVVNENGCFAEQRVSIDVFQDLVIKKEDLTICLNQLTPDFKITPPVFEPQNLIKHFDFSENENNVYLNNQQTEWYLGMFNPDVSIFNLKLFATDNNNCYYEKDIKVTILDTPKINLNLPKDICVNKLPYILPIVSSNSRWNVSDNTGIIENGALISKNQNGSDVRLQIEETNNYCGSIKQFQMQVLDTQLITFELAKESFFCQSSEPMQLVAEPQNGVWSGIGVVGNIFVFPQNSVSNYKLNYSFKNNNGCISEDNIILNIDIPSQTKLYSNKDSLCFGDILTLWAEFPLQRGYWFTEGVGRFDEPQKYATNYFPSKGDVKTGWVKFIYTIQTGNSCGNIPFEKNVFVKDGPKGDILPNSNNLKCEGMPLIFESNFGDIDNQTWFVNDDFVKSFDYNFPLSIKLKAGLYNIKTKVKDGNCEAIALGSQIEILPLPSVNFFANPSAKISKEMSRLYLKDKSYSKNGVKIKWYQNDSFLTDADEFSFMAKTSQPFVEIKLVAETIKGGCKDSLSKIFEIVPIYQLFIPDGFSPDSKGPEENNCFKPLGSKMKKYEVEIFNRFGEKVFISSDQNSCWDGSFKGENCQQGVYFYKIITTDIEGNNRDYSGTVTLVR